MLPFFTTPWALFGLLAVPVLAAIYLLRNRFRQVPVSSLMFWLEQKEARAGGLRVRRLQTPLLFFLELLALVLLVGAAAGPTASTAPGARPLVVVLDDSYSMLAGGDESARNRAGTALLDELGRGIRYSVRFILAGEVPQIVGEPARTVSAAAAVLDNWKCTAPAARLEEAIALAGAVGGDRAIILVLSDHRLGFDLEKGRVQWWGFGQPRDNLAFVNAARTSSQGQDRCLLEIANLGGARRATTLLVKTDAGQVLYRSSLDVDAGETKRVALTLPPDTPNMYAHIGDDALSIDNQVTLLREEQAPVRVEVRILDQVLKSHLKKALQATGKTKLTSTRPALLFTDHGDAEPPTSETWLVHFRVDKEADSYVGPFVLDRSHPLTEGLGLQGIVWGAGKNPEVKGRPVILAGNVPLVMDVENGNGRHDLHIRFRPDLSTLQDTPQWPILISNIVGWRAAQVSGLRRVNVRLGETAAVTVAAGVDAVEVLPPGSKGRKVPVQGRQAVIRAEETGLYELEAGDARYSFAVNTLNREESDLSACSSGRWGEWTDETGHGLEAQDYAWILLLLAALILTIHMMLVARGSGGK